MVKVYLIISRLKQVEIQCFLHDSSGSRKSNDKLLLKFGDRSRIDYDCFGDVVNEKIHTFEVIMDENSSRIRTVQFNTTTMEIHRTCKKFEFCGYLCSHVLWILSVKNIKEIPEPYISWRWTKDAKKNMHGGNVYDSYKRIMQRLKLYFVIE
ncbi:hypothetical protein GQ457_18G012060 [Hibiscus cannabinus]